jgi:hypothetical protein
MPESSRPRRSFQCEAPVRHEGSSPERAGKNNGQTSVAIPAQAGIRNLLKFAGMDEINQKRMLCQYPTCRRDSYCGIRQEPRLPSTTNHLVDLSAPFCCGFRQLKGLNCQVPLVNNVPSPSPPQPTPSRRRKTGNVQLPGIYPHLRANPEGILHGPSQDDAREAAGEAWGRLPGTQATQARPGSRPRGLSSVGRRRPHSVLRSPDEWSLRIGLSQGGLPVVVEGA